MKRKRVQFNVIETKIDESVIEKQNYDLSVDFNSPSFLYHLWYWGPCVFKEKGGVFQGKIV